LRSASRDGTADALDLTRVQQIVSGIESAQVLETFLATLHVHADASQISRRRARTLTAFSESV
jgi:hypothetical protein